MLKDINFHNATITRDLWDIMCSDMIGQGCTRKVFVCRLDPTIVLKLEEGGRSFHNIREWELWQDLENDKEASRWVAPCVNISLCGAILLQKRTKPAPPAKYPLKVPKWVASDLKYQNWGALNGKIVCHDYANNTAQWYGTVSKRLVRANWWDGTHPTI